MRTATLLTCLLVLFCTGVQAKVVEVKNPGENEDITQQLEAALKSTSNGDTVLLPAGEFRLDGYIQIDRRYVKAIHFAGRGKNRTKLYRSKETNSRMIRFIGSGGPDSAIEISGIWFQGMEPSLELDDGKSGSLDHCLALSNCVGFRIHHCRFENFGYSAVSIGHSDTVANGLIYCNEFRDNVKRSSIMVKKGKGSWTYGYGVVVGGGDKEWIEDPRPGSENFIFVEDNYFDGHRHSIAAAGCTLYVFRHNFVKRNWVSHAVDSHGGGNYGNTYSGRFIEVYHNVIVLEADKKGYAAVAIRGGEGVVFENRIAGYRCAVRLTTEIKGEYPVITQIGYLSAKQFGPDHTGINPAAEGNGDVFVWNNSGDVPGYHRFGAEVTPTRGRPLKKDRDYHVGVPRPGYKPYVYPHPGRVPGIQYDMTGNFDVDADGDGLTFLQEFFNDTDPKKADTDGDRFKDGVEVALGTWPNDPYSRPRKKREAKSEGAGTLLWRGGPQAVGQPPEKTKPTEEEASQAEEVLKRAVIQAVTAGKRKTVYVDFGGTATRAKLTAADADSITVIVAGREKELPWSDLSPAKFLAIAKKYSADKKAVSTYAAAHGLE